MVFSEERVRHQIRKISMRVSDGWVLDFDGDDGDDEYGDDNEYDLMISGPRYGEGRPVPEFPTKRGVQVI